MITAEQSRGPETSKSVLPWLATRPLPIDLFDAIRRQCVLKGYKWDPQVGDSSTLANFPIILRPSAWAELASAAETMSAELITAEREIIGRSKLLKRLGLPSALISLLEESQDDLAPTAARVMRFDFHYTRDGWRISEVNSDVPGGFSEASFFTALMAAHYPGANCIENPAMALAQKIARAAQASPHVVLVSAPGYIEDQQVTAFLALQLESLGLRAYLRKPEDLIWDDGNACLNLGGSRTRLGAVVRFYQAEWLPKLPRSSCWRYLGRRGKTPVTNPPQAIISESKRLGVLLGQLTSRLPLFERLLPESFDPRDVPWQEGESWVLKAAMSNNGDTVSVRSEMNASAWPRVVREVSRNPQRWVAQRRFEPLSMSSPSGRIFPCIGVYTVDGRNAGLYGRFSTQPIIDYSAVDVAVLVAEAEEDSPTSSFEPKLNHFEAIS